jgi:hypothetical protein
MFSELSQIADIVGRSTAATAETVHQYREISRDQSHTSPFRLFALHAPERAKLLVAERVYCERDAGAAFGPMAPLDRCSVAPQGGMPPPLEELAAIVSRHSGAARKGPSVRRRAPEAGPSGYV